MRASRFLRIPDSAGFVDFLAGETDLGGGSSIVLLEPLLVLSPAAF
jgi:hypothetical protein